VKQLRRLGLLVALVVAGAFAAPMSPAGAAAGGKCAKAAGQIPVAVVVDFGTVSGSPGGVSQVCVPVADRTNGAALLTARANLLGVALPRWDSSGLLCAIDGFPATGCGAPSGGISRYWSYWQGDGAGWGYSPIGPAAHNVNEIVTEGWRFVEGTSSDTPPVPRGPSVSTAICKATTTTGGISTGGGTNGSLSGTGTAADGTTGTVDGGVASTTGGTTGAADAPAADNQIVTMPSLPTASTTTTTLPGATTTTAPAKTAIGSSEAERKRAAEPANRILASTTEKESSGPADLLGPVAIGAVVLVLIGGGIWQARRRRAS
jgi:hypothetical protein